MHVFNPFVDCAGELDVLGASAGTLYENVPRASLKHHEVVDLLRVSYENSPAIEEWNISKPRHPPSSPL